VTARSGEVTEPAIRRLVDAFYARVRRDPTLDPVFAAAIAEHDWPEHLEKMMRSGPPLC
jgi:hemoglobin